MIPYTKTVNLNTQKYKKNVSKIIPMLYMDLQQSSIIQLVNKNALTYENETFKQKDIQINILQEDLTRLSLLIGFRYGNNKIQEYVKQFGINLTEFDVWHHEDDFFWYKDQKQREYIIQKVIKKQLVQQYDYIVIQQSKLEELAHHIFCEQKKRNIQIKHNYNHYFFSYSGFNKLMIYKDLENADFHIMCSSILLQLFKLKSNHLENIVLELNKNIHHVQQENEELKQHKQQLTQNIEQLTQNVEQQTEEINNLNHSIQSAQSHHLLKSVNRKNQEYIGLYSVGNIAFDVIGYKQKDKKQRLRQRNQYEWNLLLELSCRSHQRVISKFGLFVQPIKQRKSFQMRNKGHIDFQMVIWLAQTINQELQNIQNLKIQDLYPQIQQFLDQEDVYYEINEQLSDSDEDMELLQQI